MIAVLLATTALPLVYAKSNNGKKAFTVVIDAGHGGVDPGALGKQTKEKTVNFNVSKLLSKKIKEKYPDIKIIFTRSTDVKIPLIQRAQIANKAKADLFISIHSNAAKSSKANGCETFTLGAGSSAEAKAAAMYENQVILLEDNFEETYMGFNPNSSESYIIFELLRNHDMEKSVALAEAVQEGMVKHTKLANRGVSSGGFLVLHKTVMPSILVEVGFISNAKEEKFIGSESGQEKIAQGIFEGFSNYYEAYKKNVKELSQAETPQTSTATATATTAKKAKNTTTKATTAKKGKNENTNSGKPVFKIQILTSNTKLKAGDKRLKGLDADYYLENGIYKYTYGESTDYNKVAKMRKEIANKFGEAFVVAFIDGKKSNTKEAIEIFRKQNK